MFTESGRMPAEIVPKFVEKTLEFGKPSSFVPGPYYVPYSILRNISTSNN